jgi:TrmH family RNA methyltransferase
VTHILVNEEKADRIDALLSEFEDDLRHENCRVIYLSDSAFSKISTEKAPQGIISIIKYLDFFRNLDIIYKEDFFVFESERALSLYSLRDPGNLGAVIRSASAFGVKHIILSADSADVYNPKTVRAAMGTLFGVKITIVRDFKSFIDAAKSCGRSVYAAELTSGAKSVKEIKLTPSDIFIIGNEGHGIPDDISAACSASVYIPISAGVESLNASVAAAVFMWEQNNI